MQKIKYKRPKLESFSKTVVEGVDCQDNGATADGACNATGGSATIVCLTTGAEAIADCVSTGGVATYQCVAVGADGADI